MTDALPHTVPTAERAVLGAILHSPAALEATRGSLTGNEFWSPAHRTLWGVCCDLADAGISVHPSAVVTELGKRGQLAQWRNGVDVFELYQDTITAANVRYHVAEMVTAARVRSVQQAHTRLGQSLGSFAANGDTDALLDAAARSSLSLTLAADAPELDSPVPGLTTWEDFTKPTADPEARWIVPGLIRRHDTIMILGASGAGKSYLSRMVAMCLAAGVHPFTLRPVNPVRTLLVDLENAPDQTAEESEPVLTAVRAMRDTEQRGMVWPQPEGLDLRKRGDAMLLERVIAQAEPDVLVMGSLYNAYRRGRDDWDTAAEDVQAVLKRLRSRYGLGLWLEHHMPRAQGSGHTGTPYGGTMWERWPTHGRWLRRHPEVKMPLFMLEETFRGDRGKRELPLALTRGGKLPWTSIFDEGELDVIIEGGK